MTSENKQTPVYDIAICIACLFYIFLVAVLPFGDISTGARCGIGVISAMAGGMIYLGAYKIIEFAMKAIVEFSAVLLLLFNACAGIILALFMQRLMEGVQSAGIAKGESVGFAVIAVAAIVLFVVDLGAFYVLYPLSQIVGTRID
ncbi:hypothetical protein [Paludibaculum fermentans]|uniref:hypothetical protein n=1 Tax=Paludibaculum fermentans TaxID=1473598 RepID=UPI003EB6F503